jgi:hypothetical protein
MAALGCVVALPCLASVLAIDAGCGSSGSSGGSAADRARASALVAADVQKTASLDSVVILGPQSPLAAGTVITPTLGNDDGDADPSLDFVPARSSWFFYVDLAPAARMQHTVRYYLVDVASGALTEADRSSWPAIGGVVTYHDMDQNLASMDLIQADAGIQAGSAPMALPPLPPPRRMADPTATTHAVLIQGDTDSAMAADIQNIKAIFGNGGVPPASVVTITPSLDGTIAHPANQAAQAIADACAASKPQDTVFVYVTSHGAVNGPAELVAFDGNGQAQARDDLFFIESGGPVVPGRGDMRALGSCNACHIIVIMVSCYAGRLLSPPTLFSKLTAQGTDFVFMTATDGNHTSWSAHPWTIGIPTGDIFTTNLLAEFHAQSFNGADFHNVFASTKQDLASFTTFKPWLGPAVREQNPQIYPPMAVGNMQVGGGFFSHPDGTNGSPTMPGATVVVGGTNLGDTTTAITIGGTSDGTPTGAVVNPTMGTVLAGATSTQLSFTVPANASSGFVTIQPSAKCVTPATRPFKVGTMASIDWNCDQVCGNYNYTGLGAEIDVLPGGQLSFTHAPLGNGNVTVTGQGSFGGSYSATGTWPVGPTGTWLTALTITASLNADGSGTGTLTRTLSSAGSPDCTSTGALTIRAVGQ